MEIPFYLFTKDILGSDISALGMVAVMLPFFFLAMYEKDGFPAEEGRKIFAPEVQVLGDCPNCKKEIVRG